MTHFVGFALALHRLHSELPPADARGYLLAHWLLIWLAWTTAAVAVLGALVPPAGHLDLALPLVLLAGMGSLRLPSWLLARIAG